MLKSAMLILGLFVVQGQAETFWGAGIQGYATNQPKPSGWAATGTEISSTQRLYSFSETDFTPVFDAGRYRILTSARTGVGTYLRSYGPLDLFAVADGGVATNGSTTGGAAAMGLIGCIPLKKASPWYLMGGYRAIKTNVAGTTQLIELGVIHRQKDPK